MPPMTPMPLCLSGPRGGDEIAIALIPIRARHYALTAARSGSRAGGFVLTREESPEIPRSGCSIEQRGIGSIGTIGIGPDAPYAPYASPASRRMTKLPSGSSR
jgi:hypothetical protein